MPRREKGLMERREPLMWLVSLLLYSPMLLIYAGHFFVLPEGVTGTGFLQEDQPYYMAIARQHFDAGEFSFLYSLPFSPFEDSPRLYVQILSLLLGALGHFTNLDPGHLYVAFGLVAGLICARVAIALFEEIVGLGSRAQWVALPCFFWGGGLLALAGILYCLSTGADFYEKIFIADPFDGLWFLNFGRNLYYATESFYHLLVLGTLWLVFRRRFAWALVGLAAMSISHPFSGLQLLLVVLLWSLTERIVLREDRPPAYFVAASAVLIACHLGYYLGILNTSEEHRVLQQQWALAWNLGLVTMVPAYALVGALALWRVRSLSLLRTAFADCRNRLLAVWFLVSFLLANHDLFMPPLQPLHFTRGYIWMPLFLLGAPVLVALFERILEVRRAALRAAVLAAVVLLALGDNAIWFSRHGYGLFVLDKPLGITLSAALRDVFALMNEPRYRDHLVVAHDKKIGELATVYTPLRSWASHGFNTPHFRLRMAEIDSFFATGKEPPEWEGRALLVVAERDRHAGWLEGAQDAGLTEVESRPPFVLLARPAAAGEADLTP